MRLRKEQNKARQDEVFGGFSSAERLEYEAREKRISDLQAELKTSSQSGMTAAEQRRKWNKHPEIDSSQSHARQPYLGREKGSSGAFTDSLKTGDRSKSSVKLRLHLRSIGLEGRRLECFLQITSFVQGLAAEQMCSNALLFLEGENEKVAVPREFIRTKAQEWEQQGFRLKLAMNF